MKNNAINTYLKELSKQLLATSLGDPNCSTISSYLRAVGCSDSNSDSRFFKDDSISFLGEYSSTQLHNLVKRRKIKHFCIITACILIFAALLIYSIRRIYWFYLFQDGYCIETMYDGTDVPGPEEIGITNYQRY